MTPSMVRRQLFTGTWQCVRLILRRDRLRVPLWFGAVFMLVLIVAAAIPGEFPTERERSVLAALSNTNPAELLFLGRVHSTSIGGLTAWRVTAIGIIGLGLASLFCVLNHTRRDEEEGFRAMLGGALLGQAAPLVAACAVRVAASLVLAPPGD